VIAEMEGLGKEIIRYIFIYKFLNERIGQMGEDIPDRAIKINNRLFKMILDLIEKDMEEKNEYFKIN
jgi:hypothetical protein